MDDDDEAKAGLSKLRTYKGREKLELADLKRFLVHDDRATEGQLRSYITPGAIWDTDGLFGRSTFGYIAYDIATSRLVYLKDFWRTGLPRIEKDGDVYRKLFHSASYGRQPSSTFLSTWRRRLVENSLVGIPTRGVRVFSRKRNLKVDPHLAVASNQVNRSIDH